MTPSRLAKLKAMPPREIAHRLQYAAYTAIERRAYARGTLARPGRLFAALTPEFQHDGWQSRLVERQGAGRFFAWQDQPAAIRALFDTRYRAQRDAARGIAAQVARHEIGFFGETFQFGPEIDWHADPVTGASWPRCYHRAVPVNGGNVGFGDVKNVWELNRHQFFVDLAKVAFLDDSQPSATALHDMLRSWLSAVPYATGAPWACALEPAFRAWSWLWSYHMVRSAALLPDEVHLAWLEGFYDHGRFLHRHLERYTSPYNHLIGEASALFALGVLFPEFRESAAWRNRGLDVLQSSVGAQFYADGGTVEQSTFYHHATLGFYLLTALLAARNGLALPLAVMAAVERGIDFSMAMMQPDGRVPSIGGADDGKPIRLEHAPFWDFRAYQAVGAVLFSRPDFKAAAGGFPEDALWLLGSEGADAFERLPARAPATSRALTASGYYVARSDWSPDADYLCFDCGEQAAGLHRNDVPSAAHGHADCLSVVVALGGERVLVDPGFFCYNGDPAWEVHFRKTRAHNTLTVDGRDQARHVSKMAWTHTYEARPEGWSGDAGHAWARGSHDGYARGPGGVVHRRTVWLRDGGYVVILDELEGTGAHEIQANFQFAPGTLQLEGSAAALFNQRFSVAWTCSSDARASIACGESRPDGGWIATSLGVRQEAPLLTLRFPFAGPRVTLLTIVADTTRGIKDIELMQRMVNDASLMETGLVGR